MHHYGHFDERALAASPIYDGHSDGYRQAELVSRATGSVHTGLSCNELAAGGSIHPHVHSFEEGFYILSGEAVVTINGSSYLLGPGDYAAIKVGTPHAWRAARVVAGALAADGRAAAEAARAPSATRSLPRTARCRRTAPPLDLEQPATATCSGHFDASQIPPPGERERRWQQGLEGVFLKWLIDENFGARHHRLLFIEYQPGVSIGLHDHTFEEALLHPQRRGRGHAGRQDLSRDSRATCSGRASAASTRSPTSAASRCAGWRRSRRSRRKRTCFASWRSGSTKARELEGDIMTAQTTGRTRPFTGAEYLESLRDGREIWIYGERVKDVTTHPAFRNTARMIARLYDALHDPARQDVLTTPTDTGSGGFTHKFYQAAAQRRGDGRRARRDRRVGARLLRLDRPQPRLQGGVPGDARRQLRLLRAVRRERPALVQAGQRGGVLRQPRHRQPAGRSRQAARRGEGRVHARRGGDRRRV